MTSAPPVVCLLTDFGLTDHYVGAMKGALLSGFPNAQIIDLNHNVPAQNIRVAAFELLAGYKFQPKGAVFICVVDPGVGSDRGILYAEAGDWRFIAPDNGLLSWTLDELKPRRIFKIDPTRIGEKISSTFHGRDVMAPAAARILAGADPGSLGAAAESYVKLPFPVVLKHGSLWQGEVLVIDAYGNVVTNLRGSEVKPLAASSKLWIEFEKTQATVRGLSETYASAEPGKLIALEGSSGFIEIAVNQGNAASQTRLEIGDRVNAHFRS